VAVSIPEVKAKLLELGKLDPEVDEEGKLELELELGAVDLYGP